MKHIIREVRKYVQAEINSSPNKRVCLSDIYDIYEEKGQLIVQNKESKSEFILRNVFFLQLYRGEVQFRDKVNEYYGL